jgi:hypothetical protein
MRSGVAVALLIGAALLPLPGAAQAPSSAGADLSTPPPAPPYPSVWYPPPPPVYAPREVQEFDGFNVPAGYHVETRPRVGLVVGGAVTFGVLYMLSVSAASSSKSTEGHWLAAPIIGPFAAAGAHQDPCEKKQGTEAGCLDIAPPFELLDALGQIVGASLLTAGLLARRSVLVPDAPVRTGALVVVPSFSRTSTASSSGLSIAGTF